MGNVTLADIPTLASCTNVRGKRVVIRAGIDAPLGESGSVVDDFRIQKSLPTLKFLRAAGARIVVVGHTSRADGSADASLAEVCRVLNTFVPVSWAGGVLGAEVERKVEELQEGEILMLENLRFHEGEKKNDQEFARALARFGDLYVNDAFSVSHREHASIVGIPAFLPSYAGQLFMEELQHLSIAREPQSPSLFVLGGAKFETKLPLVEALIDRYDRVYVGGALANNFFAAKGYNVGGSLVSSVDISASPLFLNPKLLLPIDVTVVTGTGTVVKKPAEVEEGDTIVDAGPETLTMLTKELDRAATLLWNGPLGDYERGFGDYTRKFAEAVAHARGVTIVGGGDTVAAITDESVSKRFTFLSTAGGAMLSFLEKGTLPGIDALLRQQSSSAAHRGS